MSKINSKYLDPNGTWMVTTEGDCEGKTTRTLGVFTGRLDEIAFALAPKAYYKLTFRKLDTTIPIPDKREEKITVALDLDSGTYDLSADELADFFDAMLKDANSVSVARSDEYKSVTLNRINPREKKRRNIRKTALAKLTPIERAVLGLED